MPLKKSHPNLYLEINILGLLGVAIGLSMLLDNGFVPFGLPSWFLGGAFLVTGTTKIIGANVYGLFDLAKKAMTTCSALLIFTFIGLAQAKLNQEIDWAWWVINLPLILAFIQFAPTLEPSSNPVTSLLNDTEIKDRITAKRLKRELKRG